MHEALDLASVSDSMSVSEVLDNCGTALVVLLVVRRLVFISLTSLLELAALHLQGPFQWWTLPWSKSTTELTFYQTSTLATQLLYS